MTILAIFNQKGGVGKTTTTANLAAAMAREGMEPLMIDLDPQAHLTAISGVEVSSEQSIFAFYRDQKPLTELVTPVANGVNLIPSHVELANHTGCKRCKPDSFARRAGQSGHPVRQDGLHHPQIACRIA